MDFRKMKFKIRRRRSFKLNNNQIKRNCVTLASQVEKCTLDSECNIFDQVYVNDHIVIRIIWEDNIQCTVLIIILNSMLETMLVTNH